MKYELTAEQLEEMVLCIVHNDLSEGDAMEYATSVCYEFMSNDATDVEWPESNRIELIGHNGNDGLHYDKVKDSGVYEA